MVGQGCPDQKNQVALFRRMFTHTFQKINSHVSIRSVVRDLAYPFLAVNVHIGRGLRKISGAPKTVFFGNNKKEGFFDIGKPL